MLSKKKDFIGRALAARPALTDPARPTLVGLKPVDRTTPLRACSHLLPQGAPATAASDQGYITSAALSPTLGHPIALAMLSNGPARHGEIIGVYMLEVAARPIGGLCARALRFKGFKAPLTLEEAVILHATETCRKR